MNSEVLIRQFNNEIDQSQVVALWKNIFGYGTPHNDPCLAIANKVAINDGLFFVALIKNQVIGTVMAGYDGHRGWIYSLAVQPSFRAKGIGKGLMQHAESSLMKLGCPKINLQVLETNSSVINFYKELGYSVEPRISMGKVILNSN